MEDVAEPTLVQGRSQGPRLAHCHQGSGNRSREMLSHSRPLEQPKILLQERLSHGTLLGLDSHGNLSSKSKGLAGGH